MHLFSLEQMEMPVKEAQSMRKTSKKRIEKPLTSISQPKMFIFCVYCNFIFISSCLVSTLLPFVELQATICFHRYPASTTQHCKRLLEASAGLPLHIYSDAKWCGPCSGIIQWFVWLPSSLIVIWKYIFRSWCYSFVVDITMILFLKMKRKEGD